ncbi:MAG: histidine kinase, partial [Acidobacteriota bacterium]|nr:histidine kinase [Acidobacteriota bacterium]
IGMSLSNLYRFAQKPILEHFPGRLAYYASHVLIVVTGVGFGVEVAIRIIDAIGGASTTDMRPDVFRIGLVVATVIVVTVVSFEKLRERARATELVAQQAQKEALKAQLEALQARTNPHFLFNSLNTVAGLIEEDPHGAEKVLEKLSGLFRYSLDGSKTEWVRLEQELKAVTDYLEVERIRLGERLRAEVEVEPGVESLLVPPLLLQPLVENAVLHAVAPRASGGKLVVRAKREGLSLQLAVEDDGPGLGNSEHKGSGTALDDLRQRLAMVYGDQAALETESPAAGGCRVTVRLPLEGVARGEDAGASDKSEAGSAASEIA